MSYFRHYSASLRVVSVVLMMMLTPGASASIGDIGDDHGDTYAHAAGDTHRGDDTHVTGAGQERRSCAPGDSACNSHHEHGCSTVLHTCGCCASTLWVPGESGRALQRFSGAVGLSRAAYDVHADWIPVPLTPPPRSR